MGKYNREKLTLSRGCHRREDDHTSSEVSGKTFQGRWRLSWVSQNEQEFVLGSKMEKECWVKANHFLLRLMGEYCWSGK